MKLEALAAARRLRARVSLRVPATLHRHEGRALLRQPERDEAVSSAGAVVMDGPPGIGYGDRFA